VGQDLALEERLDAAVFQQRHLLGVPQLRVRLVFHQGPLASDLDRVRAVQRVRFDLARLVGFPDLRRLQHGVQPANDGHRQDHVAVLPADVDVAQDVVSNTPDEAGNRVVLCLVHRNPAACGVCRRWWC